MKLEDAGQAGSPHIAHKAAAKHALFPETLRSQICVHAYCAPG